METITIKGNGKEYQIDEKRLESLIKELSLMDFIVAN
jgi:sulfur carrier protein ThiS